MSKIKVWAWHVASWTNWYFKEQVGGHGLGAPMTRLEITFWASILVPLVLVTSPIWAPLAGITWAFNKFCSFGKGPPPGQAPK